MRHAFSFNFLRSAEGYAQFSLFLLKLFLKISANKQRTQTFHAELINRDVRFANFSVLPKFYLNSLRKFDFPLTINALIQFFKFPINLAHLLHRFLPQVIFTPKTAESQSK